MFRGAPLELKRTGVRDSCVNIAILIKRPTFLPIANCVFDPIAEMPHRRMQARARSRGHGRRCAQEMSGGDDVLLWDATIVGSFWEPPKGVDEMPRFA